MSFFRFLDSVIDHAAEAIFTLGLLGFVVALNHDHALQTWAMLVGAANWMVAQIPLL